MRRPAVATISFALSLAILGACADSPTAPTTVVERGPFDGGPDKVVASTNTLFALGALSGFSNGGVNAINTTGETSGWNNVGSGAYHAFFRALNGSMTDLGTLGGSGSIALAMNDAKTVVGLSYIAGNTTYHAFASEVSGTTRVLTDLPLLTPTAPTTERCAAYGINDVGQTIVGFCFTATGKQHAVRWTRTGVGKYTILDLQPATGWTSTFAYDINDGGTVVGFGSQTAGTRGFKFVPAGATGGTMTALGTLPGGNSSTARAINNNGDLVGWATTSTGVMHAFGIYAATPTIYYDLGATTNGPSYAFDINDNQQAVGWAQPSTGVYQPLYWNQAIVPSDLGTLSTSTSAQAQGVNDRGQVVGTSGSTPVMWFTSSNTNPVAKTTGPYTITRSNGQAVLTLDGSNSSDVDGDLINSFTWKFSDGGTTTTSSATTTHTYTVAGSYTVTLQVKDWRDGTSLVVQTTVTVR